MYNYTIFLLIFLNYKLFSGKELLSVAPVRDGHRNSVALVGEDHKISAVPVRDGRRISVAQVGDGGRISVAPVRDGRRISAAPVRDGLRISAALVDDGRRIFVATVRDDCIISAALVVCSKYRNYQTLCHLKGSTFCLYIFWCIFEMNYKLLVSGKN